MKPSDTARNGSSFVRYRSYPIKSEGLDRGGVKSPPVAFAGL
jgi:hypothetical protein